MGNANVVARELSIPLTPIKALHILENSQPVAIDVGLLTLNKAAQIEQKQIFLAMLEVGIGAQIVHLVTRLRQGKLQRLYQFWGDLVYALAGLLAFTGKPQKHVEASTSSDNPEENINFSSAHLLVANMRTYAKGWSFTPDADCRDGQLDIAYSTRSSRLHTMAGFIAAANRRKQSESLRHYKRVRTVCLDSSKELFIQIDGDPVSFEGSVQVSVLPKAFIIHTPAARHTPASMRVQTKH
jgi:diacylglycerol kinase family enzyme